MTVRGGGVPYSAMAAMPALRMGPPPRSFAADAHACIMVRVTRPTGYKVAARVPRARQRAPLGCVIPTTNSVPPCSRLSRRGLEMTEHAGTAERQPALTAPARVGLHHMWVGAKKRESQVEQRNWNEESGERCEIVLDFASLIQGGMISGCREIFHKFRYATRDRVGNEAPDLNAKPAANLD